MPLTPPLPTLDSELLEDVSGGMRWENFRRSENIEDRRPPEAIAEDSAWMAWRRPQPQPQPSPFPPMAPTPR